MSVEGIEPHIEVGGTEPLKPRELRTAELVRHDEIAAAASRRVLREQDPAVRAAKARADLEVAVRRAEAADVKPQTEATDGVLLEHPTVSRAGNEPLDGFGPAHTQEEDSLAA